MSRETERLRSAAALLLGLVLPACGPPPAPPPPTVKPAPVVAVAATSKPMLSLIGDGEATAAPTCPDPPAGEPGPLATVFVALAVPPDIISVKAVGGRSEHDVWMTAIDKKGARVALHWDGSKLSREAMSPCSLGLSEPSLSVGPDGPVVLDVTYEEFGPTYSQAHRTPKGTWECDGRISVGRSFTFGAEVLRTRAGASGPTLSGRLLPDLDPAERPQGPADILACAVDDVWFSFPGYPVIWHWNGLGYEDRSTGLEQVARMVPDATCGVWVLGGGAVEEESKSDSRATLRWDRPTQTWICVPTPPALKVRRLVAASERDVWFLGEKEAYRWDGASYQRGPTPAGKIEGAWTSTSGELWLVGETLDSRSRGLVFRTVAGGAP